jgi:hypothetical protein
MDSSHFFIESSFVYAAKAARFQQTMVYKNVAVFFGGVVIF